MRHHENGWRRGKRGVVRRMEWTETMDALLLGVLGLARRSRREQGRHSLNLRRRLRLAYIHEYVMG